MKRLTWLTVALPVFLMGCSSVHTELTIPAAPKEVWQVITDAKSYPEWNGTIVKVDGEYVEGQSVQLHLKEPDGTVSPIEAKVRKMETARHLNQTGGTPGILTYDHHYYLEPVDEGTRVTQHEEYSGIGVLFWDHEWVELAYAKVNRDLKAYVLKLKAQKQND